MTSLVLVLASLFRLSSFLRIALPVRARFVCTRQLVRTDRPAGISILTMRFNGIGILGHLEGVRVGSWSVCLDKFGTGTGGGSCIDSCIQLNPPTSLMTGSLPPIDLGLCANHVCASSNRDGLEYVETSRSSRHRYRPYNHLKVYRLNAPRPSTSV